MPIWLVGVGNVVVQGSFPFPGLLPFLLASFSSLAHEALRILQKTSYTLRGKGCNSRILLVLKHQLLLKVSLAGQLLSLLR